MSEGMADVAGGRPNPVQNPVLQLTDVIRIYRHNDDPVPVLRGASCTVAKGEFVALIGPSGSGKSTLLHIAGLLEPPDAGAVMLDGMACGDLSDKVRTRLRREAVGFVYQFDHLLPEFSAHENVIMPLSIAGFDRQESSERADALLAAVGLADRAGHRPAELSGGERQRVAIVRALANGPHLLIADEPTGNLDERTAGEVFALLEQLVREAGLAALIATHNEALASRADRVLSLGEGKLKAERG